MKLGRFLSLFSSGLCFFFLFISLFFFFLFLSFLGAGPVSFFSLLLLFFFFFGLQRPALFSWAGSLLRPEETSCRSRSGRGRGGAGARLGRGAGAEQETSGSRLANPSVGGGAAADGLRILCWDRRCGLAAWVGGRSRLEQGCRLRSVLLAGMDRAMMGFD
ncbi:hypothetical protein RchiOBHm_Chr7g0206791 [Rosa chinensis]|uniref:Transmembrane protein n=1 Tax=Rosa chinensis TaxID=74649 RepID=A0A2P6P9A4_ROSCH|nr:hypothetical protein RchiOBHm_Chr7g0206791 [Rosa chinensis]